MKSINLSTSKPPHHNIKVFLQGNTESPQKALILFHGRGSTAENILGIINNITLPNNVVVIAPEASGYEWCPFRFDVSREQNEPYLSSALSVVESLTSYCDNTYGIKTEAIVLAGFSQGASLVADFVARNPAKYKGICIFSGAIIGSESEIEKEEWKSDLDYTPVYIGCDDHDPHIPLDRVLKTINIFKNLNATVESRIYKNLGHAIHPEGLKFLSKILA